MTAEHKELHSNQPFELESGEVLPHVTIRYVTIGERAADDANVVWIFHALTANANPLEWWPGMVGANKVFDPARDFIICANVLGSVYGTSGPLTANPASGKPYYADFPLVTIRDMVGVHQLLFKHLNIQNVNYAVGASLGGQQALEWAVQRPDLFNKLVVLASNAEHSSWGRAYNAAQRMALEADPTLREPTPGAGRRGLKAARAVAMLSYRTYAAFAATQTDGDLMRGFSAESYLEYQGQKLAERFNAWSYYRLTQAMDSHHLGRGRGSVAQTLKSIKARSLIVGIQSDSLFPIDEQKFLAAHIPHADYAEIDSDFGHDGFLVESASLTKIISKFRQEQGESPGSGQTSFNAGSLEQCKAN